MTIKETIVSSVLFIGSMFFLSYPIGVIVYAENNCVSGSSALMAEYFMAVFFVGVLVFSAIAQMKK